VLCSSTALASCSCVLQHTYKVDKNAKVFYEDVILLRCDQRVLYTPGLYLFSPVRATYVRSENGYKVRLYANRTL
jgi:hypothetical protein